MDGRRIGIPVGRASPFMRVVVNGENDDDDAIAEEKESSTNGFALHARRRGHSSLVPPDSQ